MVVHYSTRCIITPCWALKCVKKEWHHIPPICLYKQAALTEGP